MKKIYIFIFFFLINLTNSHANDGVFFLDIDYIVNNSNSGKIIIKKLQDLNSKNNSILNKQGEEIKLLEDEIAKVKNVISEEELQNKVKNLKKNISLYRSNKKKILDDFNVLKKKELENFFEKITPFIEEFMNIKSIKIIFDKKNIFIANANYDITDELIKFLDEKL